MARRNLIEQYANLLNSYHWEWYAILSFREPVSFHRGWGLFNKWKLALKHRTGNTIYYCMVSEPDIWKDNPHFHVLLSGVNGEKPYVWGKNWYPIGVSKIKKYNPKLGAKYYLAEKLVDGKGDLKFSKKMPKAIFCGTMPR